MGKSKGSGVFDIHYCSTSGTLLSELNYPYKSWGALERTWGSGTYPVEYTYDQYHQRETLTTHQADDDDDQITTWEFDDATGLLTAKVYADNSRVAYTYTADGKPKTRTWARGVLTTYTYYGENPGEANTGELHTVSYTGGTVPTPTMVYAYDRLGRKTQVGERLPGAGSDLLTRTFAYRDASSFNPANLALNTETLTGLYSRTLTRQYHGSTTLHGGKDAGLTIGTEYGISYAYATGTGALNQVSPAGLSAVSYERTGPNPEIVSARSISGGPLRAEYAPDSLRNATGLVKNYRTGSPELVYGQYGYHYDPLDRRTGVEYSGEAFNDQDQFNLFGYNPRSELTASKRFLGDYDPEPAWTDELAQRRGYTYDAIGNRAKDTLADGQGNDVDLFYCVNNLNAYTATDTAVHCPLPATESFTYAPAGSNDGNLLADGTFTYQWDGENRLVAVTPITRQAPFDQQVKFQYDDLGRRVEKALYAWDPSLNNGVPTVPSMIYIQPYLYSVTEAGIALCRKGRTGETVWQERLGGSFAASPVYAEGRLYFLSEAGETVVIEAGPQFKVLARNRIGEACQASMAVSGGQCFIRSEGSLFCIGQRVAD